MGPFANIDNALHRPAKGASATLAVLFTSSCGLHIWQSRKYNSWAYTWQLPIACILVIAGFVIREYNAFHHRAEELSAIQGLFYTATFMFTLPLYTFLQRLLSIPPTVVRIHPSYFISLISCFFSAIVTCTSQGAATYFDPNQSHGQIRAGLALIKASLFLQLILNGTFVYVLALFQYRQKQRYQSEHSRDARVKTVVTTFHVLIWLIIVSNIYRTVQIFAKPTSGLWTSEAYFWAFEAIILLIYTTIFHVLHPAKYILVGPRTCKNTRRDSGAEQEEEEGLRAT